MVRCVSVLQQGILRRTIAPHFPAVLLFSERMITSTSADFESSIDSTLKAYVFPNCIAYPSLPNIGRPTIDRILPLGLQR